MSKTRVYQIAKELKISNEEAIKKLNELDIKVSDKNSELEDEEVELALEILKEELQETLSIDSKLTVQAIAEKLDKPATEIIMKLMKMGTMASINQEVSFEVAKELVNDYGFNLVLGSDDSNNEEELEIEALLEIEEDKEED